MISNTLKPFSLDYYRNVFVDWFILKRNECPICGIKMKIGSIRGHIRRFYCKTLLDLSPEQRKQVVNQFYFRKKMSSKYPHELSDEELLAREIVKIVGVCYYINKGQKKVYFDCQMKDDSYQWISGSVLSLSHVGEALRRNEYRKKNGLLR